MPLADPAFGQRAAQGVLDVQARNRREADAATQAKHSQDEPPRRHFAFSTPSDWDLHQPSVATPYATIAAATASSRRPIAW